MNFGEKTTNEQVEIPKVPREVYIKPEVSAQRLDEVVRGGGGYSGDYPGFPGGHA